MGRIFEKRKHKIFARNARISKIFSRIGKEIAIAVKAGGPNPEANPRLRAAINNARGANMPKEKIEAAIKRASSREAENYEEVTYEGIGPGGVALMVDCATDNTTRTVANLRMLFSKGNGTLGTSGSVAFNFERRGVFKLSKEGIDLAAIELDLIDFGAEEIVEEDDAIYIYTKFADFGTMQKGLESKNIQPISSEKQWIAINHVEVSEEQQEKVLRLIDLLEEDDDVQAVYHNMA
ncbi:MAG: YebC/PmpR family DNA-binding transcriptional regulator [Chitinophagales bacterium]|nr:YebC/PmpR family DNA-binding transcriptional regulator [Chitinophagales bacterium]MDW8427597.1 YebC/PmpR family DNA-binding transcriptional regulator [Chitinophagales bacterium]